MYVDLGVRCERHTGEVFPVRCAACENLRAEYGTLGFRLCPRHPAHFRPCAEGCDDDLIPPDQQTDRLEQLS